MNFVYYGSDEVPAFLLYFWVSDNFLIVLIVVEFTPFKSKIRQKISIV
jgi:hypothetical protein